MSEERVLFFGFSPVSCHKPKPSPVLFSDQSWTKASVFWITSIPLFLFPLSKADVYLSQNIKCWIYIPLYPPGTSIFPLMMQINLLCRSWAGVVRATGCSWWRAGASEYITALFNSVTFGEALWSLQQASDSCKPVERPAGVYTSSFHLWCWCWWFSAFTAIM